MTQSVSENSSGGRTCRYRVKPMILSLASRQRVDSPFSRGKEIPIFRRMNTFPSVSRDESCGIKCRHFMKTIRLSVVSRKTLNILFLSGNETLRTRMDIIRSVNALKPNKRIRRYQRISLEARADLKNDNRA